LKPLSVVQFQQHWAELESRFAGLGVQKLYIGFSGGLDSIVLAHLISRALPVAEHKRICLLHVHHGLLQQADDWADFTAGFASRTGLHYKLLRVNAKPDSDQSPEEAAREARYAAFESIISCGDYLLAAHHQNDQAETFLLQLMRGAGLAGLSAMPECRELGKGFLLRPLLSWSREQIACYADENRLEWVDDPSNLNIHFDRNFIRHQVMPLLHSRWPAVARVIQRSAAHCAQADRRLEQLMKDELATLVVGDGHRLHLASLLPRSADEVIPLILAWCRLQSVDLPSQAQLQRIFHDVIHAAADRQPCVEWGRVSLRRYRQYLFLLPRQLPLPLSGCYRWQCGEALQIPGWGTLSIGDWPQEICRQKAINTDVLQLCFRSDLLHSGHAKQWLQRYQVPPWQRDRALFVTHRDEVIMLITEPARDLALSEWKK